MPRKRAPSLRCPICKKAVTAADSDFPFCSDRCRSVDLCKWASGEYIIPVAEADGGDEVRSAGPDDPED